MTRAALYSRCSTADQTPETQLLALRALAAARGWQTIEFTDHGISGTKERRPALDALLAAVRGRRVDVVACVNLDRLAAVRTCPGQELQLLVLPELPSSPPSPIR